MGISTDSKAMDMPFPVTGGIIVRASPTQHSGRVVAGCGRRERPATEQKEASSKAALARRECKGVPGAPRTVSCQDLLSPTLSSEGGEGEAPAGLRNRPQTLISPPFKRQRPT